MHSIETVSEYLQQAIAIESNQIAYIKLNEISSMKMKTDWNYYRKKIGALIIFIFDQCERKGFNRVHKSGHKSHRQEDRKIKKLNKRW